MQGLFTLTLLFQVAKTSLRTEEQIILLFYCKFLLPTKFEGDILSYGPHVFHFNASMFIVSLGNWSELESIVLNQVVHTSEYGLPNQPITVHEAERCNNKIVIISSSSSAQWIYQRWEDCCRVDEFGKTDVRWEVAQCKEATNSLDFNGLPNYWICLIEFLEMHGWVLQY